jgi:hypothetical protein
MLYRFEDDHDFEELPTLEWEELRLNNYKTELIKNGVPFEARLFQVEKSWKLKLTNKMTGKYALELRFRDLSLNDAMVKAEYYILENLE